MTSTYSFLVALVAVCLLTVATIAVNAQQGARDAFLVPSPSEQPVPPPAGNSDDTSALLRRAQDENRKSDLQSEMAEMEARMQNMAFGGRNRLDSRRQELRKMVESAFELRQQLQRSELQILKNQLARIEQSIEMRERIKDRIIDSRVEQIVNMAESFSRSPQNAIQDPAAIELPLRSLPAKSSLLKSRSAEEQTTQRSGNGFSQSVEVQEQSIRADSMLNPADELLGLEVRASKASALESQKRVEKATDLLPSVGQPAATSKTVETSPSNLPDVQRATELRRTIADLLQKLAQYEANSERDVDESSLSGNSAQENARRDLAIHRDELEVRLRLLEIEHRDAKSAFATAESNHRRLQRLAEVTPSPVSLRELSESERRLEMAHFRVERAATLLQLYQQVDSADVVPPPTAAEPIN